MVLVAGFLSGFPQLFVREQVLVNKSDKSDVPHLTIWPSDHPLNWFLKGMKGKVKQAWKVLKGHLPKVWGHEQCSFQCAQKHKVAEDWCTALTSSFEPFAHPFKHSLYYTSALSMAWCLKVLAPCLKSGSFINFFMVAQTNYRIDSNTGVSATLCMLDGSFNCITKIWGFALFFSEQFCCPLWKSIPAQKKVYRHRTGCDRYELRLHLQRLFCLYLAHHRHVVVVVKNDKGLGVSSVCERGEDRLCISSVRGGRIRKWWRGSKHLRYPL